jgi:hypothetical protein
LPPFRTSGLPPFFAPYNWLFPRKICIFAGYIAFMLEKLARQTAVYGISTIVVRFLGYLLTPYYTRIFGTETYGIVSDIYSLIPLALTLLTMGMESSYFTP